MYLRHLELRDFRNYGHLSAEFGKGHVVLHGPNGVGKTNLLEAICVAASGTSPRARTTEELVRWGCEYGFVGGGFARADSGAQMDVGLARAGQRQIKINGVVKRRADLIGVAPVVYFWADDIGVVKGEPSVRRRLVDTELSAVSRSYYFQLTRYRRAIEQRNRVLKDLRARRGQRDALAPWDRAAARYGAGLIVGRSEFLALLGPEVSAAHRRLTGGEQSFVMEYRPSIELPNEQTGEVSGKDRPALVEELAKALAEMFGRERAADIAQGVTGRGPHREEVELLLGGHLVRAFGSQGEQRVCALAIRLGLAAVVEQMTGEKPVLLLDDVLSELDARHRAGVFAACGQVDQVVITCCDAEDIPVEAGEWAQSYEVSDGRLV
ncbi:MAG: DNA replication/repair protein RecF [Armatimonadetes bacterium]|nr:DNA replication/repair protein RecF [Armatimonadota bacterium]